MPCWMPLPGFLSAKGVAKTTLNAIAADAGMTRGAVYWHFENKDAVIQALWDRNADQLHSAFSELLTQITPPYPAENFRAALKQIIRTIAIDPEVGQIIRIVIHNVECTDEETPLQQFLRQKKEKIYSDMEKAFVALAKCNVSAGKASTGPAGYQLAGLYSRAHTQLFITRTAAARFTKDGDQLLDLFLDALLIDNFEPLNETD